MFTIFFCFFVFFTLFIVLFGHTSDELAYMGLGGLLTTLLIGGTIFLSQHLAWHP